ncbi:RicAFT regulatory complex protein RicA family protein [Bacillus cereus]|uniref:RicAFT regulatory complex protein RicA family protein n=1 Tax=Bacillus cereus TaxID=1396 RepID=UPI000BFA4209|nr:RicAFT regulatory complex protein RicA family protein [Bacillus cereus]PEX90995.1 master regulator for biofilm formation [Bacillus cereus]
MKAYTKDEIVEQAKELAKMISETEEVDFFKRAEAQIHKNENVKRAIDEIKALQKQAVNLQHYGKWEALKKVEAEIDALQDKLDNIPVVQEFKSSQTYVNDLLQLVASTISNNVTDEILVSTGGDVLKGETGAAVENKKGNCGC